MKKINLVVLMLLTSFTLISCSKNIQRYKVTFNYDNDASNTSIIVNKNEKVEKPADPIKTNFEFTYWTLENEIKEFKFNTYKVISNITLIANYKEVIDETEEFVSITFIYNDNQTSNDVIEIIKGDEIIRPEKPSMEGYNFTGWYFDDNLFDFDQSVNSSTTLIAKWEKKQPVITDEQTFTHNFSTDGLNANSYFNLTGNIQSTKVNYNYIDQILTTAMKLESTSNISFTTNVCNAKLIIVAYAKAGETKFQIPGHEITTTSSNINVYEYNLALASNYEIKRISGETQILYIKVIEPGNIPELLDSEVLVTLIPNNGTNKVFEIINKDSIFINNYTFKNELLKFDGWYLDKELTIPWNSLRKVTKNLELYAKWIKAPIYTVIAGDKLYYVTEGQTVEIEEPSYLLGKTFIGWWIDEIEPFEELMPIYEDLVLLAKYEDALSYNITYYLNGGNLENPLNKYYQDQVIELPVPTKEEYVFYGWFIEEELLTKYNQSDSIDEDLKLYAKWIHESQAIDFTKPEGYGRSTVGGNIANNKVYTVTTGNEILKILDDKRNATNKGKDLANDYGLIIYINGKITLQNTNAEEILVKEMGTNISFIGVGNKGELEGIGIRLYKTEQIIIQNLKIHHVLNSTGEGDAISIIDTKYVWVDHCELFNEPLIDNPAKAPGSIKDKYDGLLDAKKASDFITYSWNFFHDSYKASLSGFSDSDTYKRHITYHHNYFLNINSRLPLFRNGYGHIYNNYYKNIYSSAINSRMSAEILIENNIFENVANPIVSLYSSQLGFWNERGNVFSNVTYGNITKPGSELIHKKGDVSTSSFEVDYQYLLNSTDNLVELIVNNVGVGIVN